MIASLLIANRGEIACRVIRTARRIGIRTVAVYSDADANALHVRQADAAVHIGPSPARESYLVGEKIIAAARETGADAIHPGYGFLSENAEFAQAVIDAGLVWVGPRPASITAMGLKDAAKALMARAGVPVTRGYLGEDQSPARLAQEAEAIGWPVLIKAVAGGGGKGMRLVEAAEDFADALASCRREAASSFGNNKVLIEKYIARPRHIEVQVFGDTHGNIVHLFERDCSLQRRHQKVIEEAPAPGMDAATRAELCAAAVKAAKAVDYVGAGTIEFIADASEGLRADRIWFMEMNTRLQVEHPVTEEITGVDLVEWQLRVASGEPLPKRQDELAINGWAIEARLYAEDPAKGFLPSVGRLEHLVLDVGAWPLPNFTGWTIYASSTTPAAPLPPRIETGVEQGGEVSSFYDPMIAKLICKRDTREAAIDALAELCAGVQVWPVLTNAGFLARMLQAPGVRSGDVNTGFIGEHADTLTIPPPVLPHVASFALSVLAQPSIDRDRSIAGMSCFRLNRQPRMTAIVQIDEISVEAELPSQNDWNSLPFGPVGFTSAGEGIVLFQRGQPHTATLAVRSKAGASAGSGAILSPMPGKIIAVEVAQGDAVTKGQKLLTLEAMKMEHTLTAPFDGTVAELNAAAGEQVGDGARLVRIEPAS